MATFITLHSSSATTDPKYQYALLDPIRLRDVCIDRGLPFEHWYQKANVCKLTLGVVGARAGVLLQKKHLDAITALLTPALGSSFDVMGYALQLQIDDGTRPPVTIFNLMPVKATCVAPGKEDDPEASYFLELQGPFSDNALGGIGLLGTGLSVASSPAYALPAFNMRQFRKGGLDSAFYYYFTTINAGTPWTWQEIFDQLWKALETNIATPTLPFTPQGIATSFDYRGWMAGDAITHFLDRIACALKWDMTTAPSGDNAAANDPAGATVVRLGVADSTAAGLLDSLAPTTWNEYPLSATRSTTDGGGGYQDIYTNFRLQPTGYPQNPPGYPDINSTFPGGTYFIFSTSATGVDARGVPSDRLPVLYDDLWYDFDTATQSDRNDERASDWLRKCHGFDRPVNIVVEGIRAEAATQVLGSTIGCVAFGDIGGGYFTQILAESTDSLEKWRPCGDYITNALAQVGGCQLTINHIYSSGSYDLTDYSLYAYLDTNADGAGQGGFWSPLIVADGFGVANQPAPGGITWGIDGTILDANNILSTFLRGLLVAQSPYSPPPPPPPGTHVETITITGGLTLESYLITVKHGATTDDARTVGPKLPATYTLNLADHTYTVTAVGTTSGHVYTVTGGTFTMAGADASTTQALTY